MLLDALDAFEGLPQFQGLEDLTIKQMHDHIDLIILL